MGVNIYNFLCKMSHLKSEYMSEYLFSTKLKLCQKLDNLRFLDLMMHWCRYPFSFILMILIWQHTAHRTFMKKLAAHLKILVVYFFTNVRMCLNAPMTIQTHSRWFFQNIFCLHFYCSMWSIHTFDACPMLLCETDWVIAWNTYFLFVLL